MTTTTKTKTQEAALNHLIKGMSDFDKTSTLYFKLIGDARSADGAKRAITRATEKLSTMTQGQMAMLTNYSGYCGDAYVHEAKVLVEEIAKFNTVFGNSTQNLRSLIHVTMGLPAVEKFGAFLKGE
jgi:hypothetical protein